MISAVDLFIVVVNESFKHSYYGIVQIVSGIYFQLHFVITVHCHLFSEPKHFRAVICLLK